MRYEIFEGNIERLEKKLATIERKCRKYGCEFHYERLGEVFHEEKDENGTPTIVKYIEVEANGTAIYNGWEFVAALEYTDKGNIVRKASDAAEVPARYYECAPYCEHCKTDRFRKYSFVVRNVESGEFKQVGKACLKDFTFGFSAENAAQFEQWKHEIEEAHEPYGGGWGATYYETKKVLRFAAETIRLFGYAKSESADSTRTRVQDFVDFFEGRTRLWSEGKFSRINREIEEKGFNPDRPESIQLAENAENWIRAWENDTNYAHNLKVAIELDYVDSGAFGLLVSVFPTYNRELEYEAERKLREEKAREEAEGSEYFGKEGERVTVEIADYKCVTSWDTRFGTTSIYKIVDAAGHVFTWKTNGYIEENAKTIVGTVKGHNEFRGCKQTELTRCRVS